MESSGTLTDEQLAAVAGWATAGLTVAEVVARASAGGVGLKPFGVADDVVEPIVEEARRAATEDLLRLVMRDPTAVIRQRGLALIAELEAEVARITERAASGRARWDELHRAGKLQQQAQNVARDLPPPAARTERAPTESGPSTTELLAAHTRTTETTNGR
ncbi:MAG: hypothetical protein QOI20_3230 [Acidimicrobiaceae bacterium]|nr:hypothetical protein [Acidimicrobiaceae bacterium]